MTAYSFELTRIVRTALEEDAGGGDITTEACVPPDKRISGRFVTRKEGVVCGMDCVRAVFAYLSADVTLDVLKPDGTPISGGDVIAAIAGPARAILTGERTALNLLQHLSGIATETARLAEAVRGTRTRIADTRKTTPGLRMLEKYAVRAGGGSNHRTNLSDGVLIKDNHIAAAGSITKAVKAARSRIPHTLKIEVETSTLAEVREALGSGAEIIMLDNMSNEEMAEAVALINGRALTEASGTMGGRDLAEVARTGVDIISIGALTHSVRALDISLKFDL